MKNRRTERERENCKRGLLLQLLGILDKDSLCFEAFSDVDLYVKHRPLLRTVSLALPHCTDETTCAPDTVLMRYIELVQDNRGRNNRHRDRQMYVTRDCASELLVECV